MNYKIKPWIKRIIMALVLVIFVMGLNTSSIFSSNSLDIDDFDEEVGFVALAIKDKQEKPVEVPNVVETTKPAVVNAPQSNETSTNAVVNAPKSYETTTNTATVSDGLLYGSLTGYSADCPLCGGKLACTQYDVYRNGVVTYPDATYGDVRIVASSSNLPCGSIVAINSSLTEGAMYAIVLDRGVGGNNLDLLVATEAEAYNNIGRKSVSYQVVRSGW